jgi:hypothetical protein
MTIPGGIVYRNPDNRKSANEPVAFVKHAEMSREEFTGPGKRKKLGWTYPGDREKLGFEDHPK